LRKYVQQGPNKMKLTLDTNVIISAFVGQGAPYQLLQTASKNLIEIYSSIELLRELDSVLRRKKLVAPLTRLGIDPDLVMWHYRKICKLVSVPKGYPSVARDPKDDMVLACAAAAHVEAIVSGDKDLLVLNRYQNIPILRPRDALQRVMFRSGVP